MALVKYELRQVPQEIVVALWPDRINPNRTIFPTMSVYSIFDKRIEGFLDGCITFHGSLRDDSRRFSDLQQQNNLLLTKRVFYSPDLLTEEPPSEQHHERFPSGFSLGRWAAQGRLPGMFRRNLERAQPRYTVQWGNGEVDMSQSELSEPRESGAVTELGWTIDAHRTEQIRAAYSGGIFDEPHRQTQGDIALPTPSPAPRGTDPVPQTSAQRFNEAVGATTQPAPRVFATPGHRQSGRPSGYSVSPYGHSS
jgi:hypothetical protein